MRYLSLLPYAFFNHWNCFYQYGLVDKYYFILSLKLSSCWVWWRITVVPAISESGEGGGLRTAWATYSETLSQNNCAHLIKRSYFSWLPCHFIYLWHCGFFFFLVLFLFTGSAWRSRLILCISCSIFRICHFSKEFFLLENGIRSSVGSSCL
jgi:hypothetical protein